MKDVLEYTDEELNELSIEELEILLKFAKDGESLYNTRQLVEKVLMNSLYGALANIHFPLFNEAMAAAITGNGRYFIQKLANNIENKLQSMLPSKDHYLIYGDTDSVYYKVDKFVDMYTEKNPEASLEDCINWVDSFEQKIIQPIIAQTIDEFALELNAYNKEKIGAEREIIADAALFVAKKKYIARVRDSEGTRYPLDEPYIKAMGLEISQSATPTWSKKKLKESISYILDSDEEHLRNWCNSLKLDYYKQGANNIAKNGSVSNLDYNLLTDKGVPIGSRAAICHNDYLKNNNIDDKYTLIQVDDKCKRVYLHEPNPFNSNIIAYISDSFEKEIADYIDYDTNFEKYFLQPLQLMVDSLNWDLKRKTAVLDDW